MLGLYPLKYLKSDYWKLVQHYPVAESKPIARNSGRRKHEGKELQCSFQLLMRTKMLFADVNFHWYRIRHEFWKNGNFTIYCSWCWFQSRLIFGPGKLIKSCRIAWKNHRKAICLSILSAFLSFLWLYVLANRNCHHSSSCWWHSVWRSPSASCSKSWRPTRWTGSTSCPVCPRWWCARLRLSSSSRVGGHCHPGVCLRCWGGESSTGAIWDSCMEKISRTPAFPLRHSMAVVMGMPGLVPATSQTLCTAQGGCLIITFIINWHSDFLSLVLAHLC